MNAISFDTLKFARTLQADGTFTDAQSERLVEALGDMLSSDLASKQDVGEVKSGIGEVRHELRELDGRIRESELRLETKIAETKAEIIKWFFGVVGIQTAAIIGSVLTLVRAGPHG